MQMKLTYSSDDRRPKVITVVGEAVFCNSHLSITHIVFSFICGVSLLA